MGIRSERVPNSAWSNLVPHGGLLLLASCISSLRRSGVISCRALRVQAWKRQLFPSSRVGDRSAFERRHGSVRILNEPSGSSCWCVEVVEARRLLVQGPAATTGGRATHFSSRLRLVGVVFVRSVRSLRRPFGSSWLAGRGVLAVAPVDIWLILPVVICLSQRLSHACLSTNLHKVKLRMAH